MSDIRYSQRHINIVGFEELDIDPVVSQKIQDDIYERLKTDWNQNVVDLFTNTITLGKNDYAIVPDEDLIEKNPGMVQITDT